MDRTEEDMKHVGFFGIFKQSFKTIFSSKKIFTQITLAFILPLIIIFIIHMEISNRFFWQISYNSLPSYYDHARKATPAVLWLYYVLFQVTHLILLTVFSLLSTAAAVFIVASDYTGRDNVNFHMVTKVIRNVWKRLFITFLVIYVVQFVYDVIINVVMAILRAIIGVSTTSMVIMIIILIIFELGFLYLSVVCQLASVVTVMENIKGFKALKKGKHLAKGKKKVGMGIAFVLYGVLAGLIIVFLLFVRFDVLVYWAMIWRVMLGILCVILFLMLFLVIIVTQTVLYLVCKSYHREVIDKLSLSTFLSVYTTETVVIPKPGEEIQLGRTQPAQQV